MKKKNVLILGGNGFIGQNLSRYLSKIDDISVTSFDLVKPKDIIAQVSYLEGDFFDTCTLQDVIENQDCIIHCISTVNPGNSNKRYMEGYQRDFLQTVQLCNMIKDTEKKLIFLSSGGTVYGNQNIQPIIEESSTKPINHYGATKVCIESAILAFNAQSSAKMIIARIANPYGPGQDYHKGVGFIDAAIKKAINEELLEIWGKGDIIRDYIYIEDVCKMIFTLIQYEGTEAIFNLSSGQGVSQNQIVEQLRKDFPNMKVQYLNYRNVDVKKLILDNTKIKTLFSDEILQIQEGLQLYLSFLLHRNE